MPYPIFDGMEGFWKEKKSCIMLPSIGNILSQVNASGQGRNSWGNINWLFSSAMLLNLNSGCNPPPNDTCYPADDVLECNETMQSAGKAMAFIGKFAVACCFSILYTFSAELYPTCVRSSALGLNSSMARVGGAVSPLMFGLDGSIPWFSNTVFASLAFIGKLKSCNRNNPYIKKWGPLCNTWTPTF